MANHIVEPSSIAPPAANYAHAVLSIGPSKLLHTCGVVPIAPDHSVPEHIADQASVIWDNIAALLGEVGMVAADIVSVTTYVVADHLGSLPQVMAARDVAMAGHRAASTLVTVPALARPEWKMEITVVAAQ